MSCGRTWRAMGATVRSRTSMGLWWSWNSWEPAVVAQHPRPPWKWALRSLTSRKEHFDGVLLTNEFSEICDVFSIYVYSYLKKAGARTHRSGTEAWSLAQPYFLICQVGQENLCFSLASLLWLNSSDQCPTLKPGKRSKSEFQRSRRWWKSLLNRNRSPLRAWRRQAEAKMKKWNATNCNENTLGFAWQRGLAICNDNIRQHQLLAVKNKQNTTKIFV